jgi:hypothetical protein
MGLNDDFRRMNMNDNMRLDQCLVAVTKACKCREEMTMRLEMSKRFITTTRQFTKEIKVRN